MIRHAFPRWVTSILAASAVFAAAGPGARAGSYSTTVQSTTATADDSYLVEDTSSQTNGTKSDLRVKASSNPKRRFTIVSATLPTLTGKTVLQAWLNLREYGASSATPIDARIYPLTQSWTEPDVSWDDRNSSQQWNTPGGTFQPNWTGRTLVSTATNNSTVGWQVGPIVGAWQFGTLANNGFVIQSDATAPDREVVFRSSEYTSVPAHTPQLVVYYTDEAPAIRTGYAEFQPTAVRARAANIPLTLWLDVDASGTTPSGAATGFDLINISHAGALVGRSIDLITVNGVDVPLGSVTSFDTGTSFSITVPKIRTVGRVRIDLHADVLASGSSPSVEIPVYVDDATTPSVWQQVLWPRDADGIPGNGDTWLLAVTSGAVTRIDLTPDVATVVERLCTPFTLYGEDVIGNRFVINPDSLRVQPTVKGTVSASGLFCATEAGAAKLIAYYGTRRDTSQVTVTPALTPVVSAIVLRDRSDTPTTSLSPADTMFLDVSLADGDGFRDITRLDASLAFTGHANDLSAPAFRAEFRWQRGAAGGFALVDPVGSNWQVLPALSSIDTLTNSTLPQSVRFAFRVGSIARASAAGDWAAALSGCSSTPPDTSTVAGPAWNALTRLSVAWFDSAGSFAAGNTGATLLPPRDPGDGSVSVTIAANAPYAIEAVARDFVGVISPSDTLRVGAPTQAVSWAFNAARTGGGRLDTTYASIAPAEPAPVDEAPITRDLYLWIDHPASAPSQDYRGSAAVRLAASAGIRSAEPAIPLTATIAGAGAAAQSAVAEVQPNNVSVGVAAQSFTAYVRPTFALLGGTGIDRILISIPAGYGTASITSVRVDGLPVAYTDASRAGVAEARLGTSLIASALIEIRFEASTPMALNPGGANFVVQYDDAGSPFPPQIATEGNANGISDGESWNVTVSPGPVDVVQVTPESALLFPGDSTPFTASAADAFGHPLTASFTWTAEGGLGTVTGSGLFTATAVGAGRVIARTGTIADTAVVTVRPARGISMRNMTAPTSLFQGQDSIPVTAELANLGADSLRFDALTLRFTRVSPGDADGDFLVTVRPETPAGLSGGDTVTIRLTVRVNPGAATGAVSISARAVATEISSGIAVEGDTVGAPVFSYVGPGGIGLAAQQAGRAVLPGERGVVLFTATVTNYYPTSQTLQSLRFEDKTVGPGDVDQRDAEMGDLHLYRDDGDGALDPEIDTLLLETVGLSGAVTFAPLSVTIPAGGSVSLLVAADVPLIARDGDVLDLAIDGDFDAMFGASVFFRTGWPLSPLGGFAIDGMAAAQVSIGPTATSTLVAGATNELALEVLLPANGYDSDLLQRLGVANLGTAASGADISRVRAWVDDGDALFDPARDRLLADLIDTGDRWQRTGLAEPVSAAGLRIFFSVDFSDLAREGRTVRLAIPGGADGAVGMASGNSGPRDRSIESPLARAISTANRVTLAGAAIGPSTVKPGASGVRLHEMVAVNSYDTDRTLTDVTYTNTTAGPGDATQRDREISSLVLRLDDNGDGVLDDLATDPVIGASFFSGGRASFTGLATVIPAGRSIRLFLLASVARDLARDSDVLAATVADGMDIGFLEPTTVTAAWPVDANARATVDGMTAEQISNLGGPGVTVGPSDGPIRALDVIVPRNGYQDDVLRSLRVVNLGTVTSSAIAELRLWADGGDGVFSAGAGDDRDLGGLVPVSGGWQSTFLSEPLASAGGRFFVSLTTSAAPDDSATVRLAVPPGGIQVSSDNDGPIDLPVENSRAIMVSTSALLAAIETVAPASTVGTPVTVRMTVRNAGTEAVNGITPDPPAISGSAGMIFDSGPLPSFVDLAPGESSTTDWTYHSSVAGDALFEAGAQGTGATTGLTRRAIRASSNVHRVYVGAVNLSLFPVQSMPASVRRGQSGVVPFSLTFTNEGGTGASDIRLRRLKVRIEDETGSGVVPSDIFTRVEVSEGSNLYLAKTALESTGADIDLTLAAPVRITPQEPVTLTLRFDLAAAATIPTMRVVILDGTTFTAEDATSGAPVSVVRSGASYPLLSGVARLVADATELQVAAAAAAPARVSRGADDVPLLALQVQNPGIDGITSDIRVSALGVAMTDTLGTPVINPLSHLNRIVARTSFQTHAVRVLRSDDSAGIGLLLSPPLSVPANTPVILTFFGDVTDTAAVGSFRVQLEDSATVDARDATTRARVPVVYASAPVAGPPVKVEQEARTILAEGRPSFPATASVGDRNLAAMRIVLRHPAGPGTARLRLDSLTVSARDETRAARVPDVFLARLRLLVNGVEVANLTGLPTTAVSVIAPLGAELIEPGDSAVVDLLVDLSPSAPAAFLELAAPGIGIMAADANSGLAVRTDPAPGAEFPLISGLVRLTSPARNLVVGWTSRLQAAVATDGREAAAASLRLSNPADPGSGSIRVDHLRLRASDAEGGSLALGTAVGVIAAYIADSLWAQSDSLSPDSTGASLVAGAPLEIRAGEAATVDLRFRPQLRPAATAFRIGIDGTGIGVEQPGGALLAIVVSAEPGSALPFWTQSGSFSGASLAESWSSFPNPFAAGRQSAAFVYYLSKDAGVTLRMWDATGERVLTILDRAPRTAGVHQEDVWTGRNGRGEVVRNGVYIAELVVAYSDGTTERVRRKVAVVR